MNVRLFVCLECAENSSISSLLAILLAAEHPLVPAMPHFKSLQAGHAFHDEGNNRVNTFDLWMSFRLTNFPVIFSHDSAIMQSICYLQFGIDCYIMDNFRFFILICFDDAVYSLPFYFAFHTTILPLDLPFILQFQKQIN